MNTEISPATVADLAEISGLAAIIWRAHYPGIITAEQIDYMLARMLDVNTLRHELERGVMDLVVRRWRVEIEQGFYISAHDLLPVIASLPFERRVASTENSRVSANGNRPNGGTLRAAS